MRLVVASILIVLIIPSIARATVRINEIAWMGITGDNGQFGEWIELYNDGDTVDLAGWKLYGDAGAQLLFTLTKTIPSGGYLLIERTTASMPDPVPGVDDESGTFGGGGLSNTGEDLILKDSTGTTIQTLSFASGWPVGDAATKKTMQYASGTWITADATPKAGNTSTSTVVTTTTTTEDAPAVDKTTGSKKTEEITYTPKLSINIPNELFQYVDFTITPELTLENGPSHKNGPIEWNMGDGTAFIQDRLQPVTHRYNYPGVYTIWIGYYRTVFDTEPFLVATKTVKVGSPSLVLSVIDKDALEITNESGKSVDLSKWQIISDGAFAVLAPHTFLAPDASVTWDARKLGFASFGTVALARPNGEIMTTSAPLPEENPPHQISATRRVLGAEIAQPLESSIATERTPESDIFAPSPVEKQPMRNRTKKIIYGAVLLTVLALFILLQRLMAKRE